MRLQLAAVGHPVGGDLQRVDHRGPDPAGPARRALPTGVSAASLLRRNLLVYGVGGIVVPFLGIKIIDLVLVAVGTLVPALALKESPCPTPSVSSSPALRALLVLTVLLGDRLPARRSGASGRLRLDRQRDGSLVDRRRPGGRLVADRADLRRRPAWFQPRALGRRLRRAGQRRHQPRTRRRRAGRHDRRSAGPRSPQRDGVAPARVPADAVTASGVRPGPLHLTRVRRASRSPGSRRPEPRGRPGAGAGARAHRGPQSRLPRAAAGQRARAQSGAAASELSRVRRSDAD